MSAIPSPCVSVCQMRPPTNSGPSICQGCFRSIDEIMAWGRLSDDAKRAVWMTLPERGMPVHRLQWMHAA